jgi:hypothetical protein
MLCLYGAAFLFMQGRALTTAEKSKFIAKLGLPGGNVSKAYATDLQVSLI